MKRAIPLLLCCLLLFCACGKEQSSAEVAQNDIIDSTNDDAAAETRKILVATVINDEEIDILSEPLISAERIDVAVKGQMFEVLTSNAADGWHEIAYDGGSAFINAEDLYLCEWESDATLLFGEVINVDSYVNFRSDASTSANVVAIAENGMKVIVRKENYAPGWHQIDWQGNAAYISADYLSVEQTSIEEVLSQ